MHARLHDTYRRLPPAAQTLAVSAYGLKTWYDRLGFGGSARIAELESSQWFRHRDIVEYQDEMIRNIVSYAAAYVPYYQELFRSAKISPRDIDGSESLASIPTTSKEELRSYDGPLSARNPALRTWNVSTSGTSGAAFTFPTSRDAIRAQWAIWWRYRANFGFRPGDWHINFTGKTRTGKAPGGSRTSRTNLPARQLVVGMGDLTRGAASAIALEIRNRRIQTVTGYPSVIADFARLAIADSRPLYTVKLVTAGAEPVAPEQRRMISQVFPLATITDQYGLSEGAANLSRCPEYAAYHEDFEFAHVEPVPIRGSRGLSEIVGTGFWNLAFPFIRYRTGDVVVGKPFECRCGRESLAYAGVQGRLEDDVVTSDGRRIRRFDYIFKETHQVASAQVVQEAVGEVVIRLVLKSESAADESEVQAKIERALSEHVGAGLTARFEFVDVLSRTQSGKFKAVVSNL